MAALSKKTNIKIPAGTKIYSGSVFNWGVDKRIPFGLSTYVLNKKTGAVVGFISRGKFFKSGEKDTTTYIQSSSQDSFTIDDLNKTLPNGGIDISHVNDYINNPNRELSDAAAKVSSLISLGIWNAQGQPVSKGTADFGKISFTQDDLNNKAAEIAASKNKELQSSYATKSAANTAAKTAGHALPYPDLALTAPAVIQPDVSTVVTGTKSTVVPSVNAPSAMGTPPATETPPVAGGQTMFFPKAETQTMAGPQALKKPVPSGKPPKGSVWDGSKWVAPPKTPVLTQEDFLSRYGTTLAFVNSDPSLQELFNKASKGNWNGPRFQTELKNTAWAAKYTANAQAVELSRTQSPSTYADSYNRMRKLIAQTAVAMGESIRPQDIGNELVPAKPGIWTAADVPQDNNNSITIWALQHIGDKDFDANLKNHIATIGQINLQLPGGQAGGDIMKLKSYAAQMGLSNMTLAGGANYFTDAAQSILLGKSTYETWQGALLQQAKDKYKAFAPSLDAGQSVQSLAAPYINTLANLLEIPAGQIDIGSTTGYGKMVNDALTGIDPANQKPIALYDFERQVKARPEWGQTNNARDTIMGGVNSLLKSFGKVS